MLGAIPPPTAMIMHGTCQMGGVSQLPPFIVWNGACGRFLCCLIVDQGVTGNTLQGRAPLIGTKGGDIS